MKKNIVKAILLFLALGTLSGCVLYNGKNKDGSPKGGSSSQGGSSSSDSSEVTPTPEPGAKVNLYLVLGPNGLLDGAPGANIAGKYLENAKQVSYDVGALLPTETRVTASVTGVKFSHWIDRETTERVDKAPATESVLVAVFTGGDGGSTPVKPGDLPSEGYGFMFEDLVEGKPYWKLGTYVGEETIGLTTYTQYKINDFQLVKYQRFQLYDFGSSAGWTVELDPYSCASQGNEEILKQYLTKNGDWYEVNKTFDAKDIYIKLSLGNDQLYVGREPDPDEIPGSGYGFMFKDLVDGKAYWKIGTQVGDYDPGTGKVWKQFQITDFQLVAGQKFRLYDFKASAGWTVDLDPYSCGAEGNAEKVKDYIEIIDGYYTVKQTFTTAGIYIKLLMNEDMLYIGKA